ncbi:cytochrome-c peroxidase [Pseudoruegeria sp. HB172150]|uniref:cytochrome-c peroxidase n=1 Tax=Pseudoruegeria sp. HB172150 TaxID=2721164 RepID=UPI0015572EA2|nr:cytochrome c peroxidase [Pseudoruegeria sp. HB172150]
MQNASKQRRKASGRNVIRILVTCLAFLVSATPSQAETSDLRPLSEADYRPYDPAKAEIGRLLFYDKILSGNRNISCGTCHTIEGATSDGLSLGVGEGGVGTGPERRIPDSAERPDFRMSRNTMAMFNLGHRSIRTLLHDGRVTAEDTYGRGFDTPAEEWLPLGLQSVLAAQALFPLASRIEMAGRAGENEAGTARNERIDYAWPILTARVATIPEYMDMFATAFSDVSTPEHLTIAHIGNALDDFINSEWRTLSSPFDTWLSGDGSAFSTAQGRGLELFYGKAGCSECHSGQLLTDQQFYALAIPPFGPGRVRRFDPYARDLGRMVETDLQDDAYRFRTPSLRNVARTGPWGHNGAFASLDAVVRHHLNPLSSLAAWDSGQVVLPQDAQFAKTDFVVLEDRFEMDRYRMRVDIEPITLSDSEISDIVAFLHTLTDEASIPGRLGKPEVVPSNLPVD